MNKKILNQLIKIFKSYPQIKLVYFFGSKVTNNYGPLSDYDFAVYLNEKDKIKIFKLQAHLLNKISLVLKTDRIDIIILDETESPELKYNIIKEGKLLFERQPYKLLVEPKILNEYFDYYYTIKKYNLTKS